MGQTPRRSNILSISNAVRCEIGIDVDPGYSTGDFVRLTDLNGAMPVVRGMDEINNARFKIVMTGALSFLIKYPVTDEYVDSTNFPPYVSGGYCNEIVHDYNYLNDDEE